MLSNGTKVRVENSGTVLDGHVVTVCGIAAISKPIIGHTYIVEFPESLRTDFYNYTHAVILECWLSHHGE